MSKAIVVGYEPNTRDRAPVRFGVELALVTGAPLIVACVSHDAGALKRLGSGHMDEDLCEDAGPALDAVKDDLEPRGVAVRSRDVKGLSAPRALHELAEAEDAGLLIIGSKRDGPVGHVLLGTTVERLVNGAPCPIAVVPQGWQPAEGLHAIGVGYVESDEATDALRAAHTLARRAGATLQVITVATVNYGLYAQARPGEVVYPPDAIAEVEAEERAWAEQALHAAIAKLGGDVPVDAQTVVSRSPAEPLISASAHLDLLVCGSRGYGPVRSVLLGGVTRRVAAAAQCPVMVVPRGTRGALESLMTDVGVPVAA